MAREPNDFELQGDDTRIHYTTTSFAGVPQFLYETRDQSLNFSGEDIHLLETEIGKLATVTVEHVPDYRTITLTLLVPAINLQGEESSIETEVIVTTHHTTVAGQEGVEGQVQTYQTMTLQGTARESVF